MLTVGGLRSPGHLIYAVVHSDGQAASSVWLAVGGCCQRCALDPRCQALVRGRLSRLYAHCGWVQCGVYLIDAVMRCDGL